jgi:hypothetical protein
MLRSDDTFQCAVARCEKQLVTARREEDDQPVAMDLRFFEA